MNPKDVVRRVRQGELSRREFASLLAAAGIGVAVGGSARGASAASKLLVFEWAGYEDPMFYPEYLAGHEAPSYAFFGGEEEALQKLLAGFEADITHPCTANINRWREAGVIRPIDTARIARWPEIIPKLLTFKGVEHDGKTWFMPWDWGYSVVAYRPDLLPADKPTFELMLDPRAEGKVGMNQQFDVALAVAGEIAGFADLFNPTDAEAAKLPAIWKQLVKNSRFLWSDSTEIENAVANGEVAIAYLWGSSVKSLREQGIQLEIIPPVLPWACGLVLNTSGTADDDLAYEYLNALLDPEGGKNLLGWGYGHANGKSFELADPAVLESLGFSDVDTLFAQGKVFDEVAPDRRDQLIEAWEEAQAGL